MQDIYIFIRNVNIYKIYLYWLNLSQLNLLHFLTTYLFYIKMKGY